MKITLLLKIIKIILHDFLNIYRRELNYCNKKPTSAIFFLTYRCDSRCKTCVMWKNIHDDEITKELNLAQWLSVVDVLLKKGVKVFELFGGNILLRKDLLIPLVTYLHERGAIIHMATNQIGLDDEVALSLVSSVNTVYVSTDGVATNQENIRGVEGSSVVGKLAAQKLLHYRSTLKKQSNNLRIVCNCTVSKYNYDKVEEIAAYAFEMGFDEVHYEYLCEFKNKEVQGSRINDVIPNPYFIEQDDSLLLNIDQAKNLKENLKKIIKNYKNKCIKIVTTNIDLLSVENIVEGTVPQAKCYIKNNIVTVDPYGNTVPCPFINNYKIGNVLENSFDGIWKNERFQNFRKLQTDGELPMCRQCILGIIYNNSFFTSIKRIYYEKFYQRLRF